MKRCERHPLQWQNAASDVIRIGFTLVLAMLVTTCVQPSYSDSQPVTLPTDWPVPELSVIPGAVRSKMTSFFASGGDGNTVAGEVLEDSDKLWIVSFNTSEGFTAVQEHTENCLRPLGYLLTDAQHSNNREYVSADGKFLVHLVYDLRRHYYRLHVVVASSIFEDELASAKPIP